MNPPERVTISLDDETANLFKAMKKELKVSQSALMREALKFYRKYRTLFDSVDEVKLRTFIELLSTGEHVIVDIDHWLLFLDLIETHPGSERFWEAHKAICAAHAEEFKYKRYHADHVLKRLETCNLFKLHEDSTDAFTVVLSPDIARKFIKTEIEEILGRMGLEVGIKEDMAKLRVRIVHAYERKVDDA